MFVLSNIEKCNELFDFDFVCNLILLFCSEGRTDIYEMAHNTIPYMTKERIITLIKCSGDIRSLSYLRKIPKEQLIILAQTILTLVYMKSFD